MILIWTIWLRTIPREGREIIYQYQKRSFARGHRDGAVQYFGGAHSFKEVASGRRVVSFFIRLEQVTSGPTNRSAHDAPSPATTLPSAIEAIKRLVEHRGGAWRPWILAGISCFPRIVAGRY